MSEKAPLNDFSKCFIFSIVKLFRIYLWISVCLLTERTEKGRIKLSLPFVFRYCDNVLCIKCHYNLKINHHNK